MGLGQLALVGVVVVVRLAQGATAELAEMPMPGRPEVGAGAALAAEPLEETRLRLQTRVAAMVETVLVELVAALAVAATLA